jgi:phosphatidylinositol alpha-1,6-mannosyltransferase
VPYYLFAYGKELLLPLYGRLPEWRRNDFARAAGVIACSHATATLAHRLFGLSAAPGVVAPAAGPRPADGAVRSRAAELRSELRLASPRAGPVVCSTGRLVARKGFDLVIRSVADLSTRFPHLQYVLAGDGPERPLLTQLARDLGVADRVHFLGAVDDLTKWAGYELADLFVMPNRAMGGTDWEGFGIVFAEAALAGRAAIGGRSGGAGDAIADGETGLLVDPESRLPLTAAIERLLEDPDLRCRLATAARARALTEFSEPALAARLEQALGWN